MIWDLRKYSGRTAIVESKKMITYDELYDAGSGIAAVMESGSLAFILCRNNLATVAAYTAFLNNSIVPLMLDADIKDDVLKQVLEHYKPGYMWLPSERDNVTGYIKKKEYAGYSLLEKVETESPKLAAELALLISTSGSTGSPKLVRLSRRNIISNTESIIEYLKINENEKAISSLPLNYVYGLSVLNTHLYAGACMVLTQENCYSKAFWDTVEREEVTSFAGIPFMYEMMDKLKFTKKTYPTLRTMTQAGGKLSPELHEKFALYAKAKGIDFVVMYGASEATARMGYLPADMAVKKKGSMGIAIPGGRFELIDADDKIIENTDETGELVYFGDNVSMGYSEKPEDLLLGDENKGRLKTGDMAYRDKDGYYYIVGRRSRFVKMTGKKLNLAELEQLLKRKFDIIDLACGGEDDALKIYITDDSLKKAIEDEIYNNMKINRHLFSIRVIDTIPKNGSGKVLYAELDKEG